METSNIYPTPVEATPPGSPAAPDSIKQPPGTPIKHLGPRDYLKLLGLGVLACLLGYVLFFLAIALLITFFLFSLFFVGFGGHVLTIAIVFVTYYAITSFIMAKWDIFGYKQVAFTACLLIAAMMSLNLRVRGDLGHGELLNVSSDAITVFGVSSRYIIPLTFIVSALSFVIMAFITDRVTPSKLSTAIALCIPLLAFGALTKGYSGAMDIIRLNPVEASPSEFTGTTLQDWLLRPTYVIPGTHISTYCEVADTAPSYTCDFYFKEYPGYLSVKAQSQIAAAQAHYKTNSDYSPSPFIKITVSKHDAALDTYWSEDKQQCDLLYAVMDRGAEWFGKPGTQPARLKDCDTFVTASGTTVYHVSPEAYKDSPDYQTAVPTRLYFRKDNTAVRLEFGGQGDFPQADRVTTTYFTDENFRSEMERFIDSFAFVR